MLSDEAGTLAAKIMTILRMEGVSDDIAVDALAAVFCTKVTKSCILGQKSPEMIAKYLTHLGETIFDAINCTGAKEENSKSQNLKTS